MMAADDRNESTSGGTVTQSCGNVVQIFRVEATPRGRSGRGGCVDPRRAASSAGYLLKPKENAPAFLVRRGGISFEIV